MTKKKSDPVKRTDEEINDAVRVLLDAEYLLTKDQNLVLAASQKHSVYVVPSVMDSGSTADRRKIGEIEYQVSNGMRGYRSRSLDVYSYREAMSLFSKICEKGWEGI